MASLKSIKDIWRLQKKSCFSEANNEWSQRFQVYRDNSYMTYRFWKKMVFFSWLNQPRNFDCDYSISCFQLTDLKLRHLKISFVNDGVIVCGLAWCATDWGCSALQSCGTSGLNCRPANTGYAKVYFQLRGCTTACLRRRPGQTPAHRLAAYDRSVTRNTLGKFISIQN